MRNVISKKLRNLRINNRLTKVQVAEKLGITISAYGYYEFGYIEPNIEILNKIADLYNVSVDYLLANTEDTVKPIINK